MFSLSGSSGARDLIAGGMRTVLQQRHRIAIIRSKAGDSLTTALSPRASGGDDLPLKRGCRTGSGWRVIAATRVASSARVDSTLISAPAQMEATRPNRQSWSASSMLEKSSTARRQHHAQHASPSLVKPDVFDGLHQAGCVAAKVLPQKRTRIDEGGERPAPPSSGS